LDYDLEYDSGIPDDAKFPEYRSKLWRFFNTDAAFTTGFFRFGDVESGAVMTLKVYLLVFSSKPFPSRVLSDSRLESLSTTMT
jgi:hypothetical protein